MKTIHVCPFCSVKVVDGGLRWYCDASHPEWFGGDMDKSRLLRELQEMKTTADNMRKRLDALAKVGELTQEQIGGAWSRLENFLDDMDTMIDDVKGE
jgi:hypothetical protein